MEVTDPSKKRLRIARDCFDKCLKPVISDHPSYSEQNDAERLALVEPLKNLEKVDDSCGRYQDFKLDSNFEDSVLELLMNVA